ncbi:MAG: TetR/AcrR family transcriptional regulator [Thermoleophilaceae bacterium]|nr:TetR/AcrR family transcriptional regulator [Thermoleophilaceae bacterium]
MREPQMLDAALRVFADRGYTGATMDDIAGAAGVTKPLVYSYFASKEDLFERCVEHAGDSLMEAMESAGADEEDPERMMWERALAYFRFVGDHSAEWRLMITEPIPGEGLARTRIRVVEQMQRFLEEGIGGKASELEPLAHALVGVGEALANWWMDHPHETAEAMAVREMNFVWAGLRALDAGERWLPPEFTSP